MKSWRSALVALLSIGCVLALTSATPSVVRAAGTGVIDGQVVNGTAGGPVPADLKVTVHIIQDRNKVGERVAQTDGEGRFHVDGLDTGPNLLYFPITEYAGVAYFPSQPIVLDGTAPGQTTISVFEPSSDPAALTFDRANLLIVNVTPSALTVMEMGAVVNAGDRTYAPDPQITGSDRTLRFILPRGATSVTPQTGLPSDTLDSTPDGFATTDPVKPGRRELAFSYQLPYDSATLDLTKSFALPVGTFTIFVPDRGIDLVGPGLVALGSTDFGGQHFRQYVAQNVGPDSEVRFRLTNLPAPIFARPRDLGFAVVVVGSVLLLVMVAIAVRRRRRQPVAPPERPMPDVASPSTVGDERQQLIRSLAELDDRFEAGDVPEPEYRSEREAGKARLLALATAHQNTP